ncbi:MAG: hypothetical protein ACE5JA_01920 [bacterium]
MARKNMVIGALWIFLFMILGSVLEFKLGAGEEWLQSPMRQLWKTAHLHGAIFGILNIIYALLITRMKLNGKTISAGSILALAGALVFPTSLFLAGIFYNFVYAAPFGGVSMILAWLLMSLALTGRKAQV